MKNTNNTLVAIQTNQVIEVITDMDNDDTISIYNDYANCNGYELIFDNDEGTINDLFSSPYDAIRQTNNKDYKDHENYFTFNGHGHAVSFDYRLSDNSPIDISELAQWLISEDKLAEYDITVTTLDDMYNCILDNLEDIDSLGDIIRVNDLLGLSLNEFDSNNESPADYEANLINNIMFYIEDNYQLLSDVIDHLGINYQ